MKLLEKKKAIELRKGGSSLGDIAKILGVSKGSISVWVRKVELTKNVRKELFFRSWTRKVVEKRRLSRLHNEEIKRAIIIDHAKRDFKKISLHELKIIGSMLYWAEGGKTKRGTARFSNSDPILIQVIMEFFRKVCCVEETRFRAHIHIHSHLQAEVAKNYWSKITNIPSSQFYKTYIKPSKASKGKKDSLPHGTLDVSVCDTRLFLTIMGWMQRIGEIIISR